MSGLFEQYLRASFRNRIESSSPLVNVAFNARTSYLLTSIALQMKRNLPETLNFVSSTAITRLQIFSGAGRIEPIFRYHSLQDSWENIQKSPIASETLL